MGITQNQIAVVLLGRPGSGKGTQAQLLAASGWRHVNVGGLVRSRVAAQTAWGKRASQFMLRGELLPSQVIQELLANELICGKFPVVIEGYPRRLEEAGTVSEMCGSGTQEIPIYIDVSISVSIARLNARLVCQVCGSVDRIGVRVTCAYCGGTLTRISTQLIWPRC